MSELIKTDLSNEGILVIYLNRNEKFNALNNDLMYEMHDKIEKYKSQVNAVIIHGNEKSFAAGLDIEYIKDFTSEDLEKMNFMDEKWFSIAKLEIPTIAAVSGYALGGGFELALMCDFIIADNSALVNRFLEDNDSNSASVNTCPFFSVSITAAVLTSSLYLASIFATFKRYLLCKVDSLSKRSFSFHNLASSAFLSFSSRLSRTFR